MKKKLILFTNSYPFKNSEQSFIKQELPYLASRFYLIIVANESIYNNYYDESNSAFIISINKKYSLLKKISSLVASLFNFLFWNELFIMRRKTNNFFFSIFNIQNYLMRANYVYSFLKRNIEFNDDGAILYSYWYNHNVLASKKIKNDFTNIKIITRVHGFDLFEHRIIGGYQPFRKQLNESIDKIFFISQNAYNYYLQRYCLSPTEKYVLSYLGTSNRQEVDVKHENKNENYLIVSCSNIIALKRVDLIIYALELLEDFNINWVHLGDGVESEDIKILAESRLGHKENIRFSFEGRLNNSDVHKFYQNNYVDIFITTSSSEGAPVSIMEALSYGIPIIGTDVGGIPEMLQDNGILLNENPSPQEIKNSIITVISKNSQQVLNMRNNSRRIWERKFNADNNYISFINEISKL